MTITEFAIVVFKSPPDFSDPTVKSLLGKLSAWQSECSGFPLRFFTNPDEPTEVHLVTGWTSVAAHEAWIRGERNQELLRVFAPYIDMQRVRMVHLGVDPEMMPRDAGYARRVMVVQRYDGARWEEEASFEGKRDGEEAYEWSLVGRDLAQDGGDVFRFVGVAGGGEMECKVSGGVERWVLEGVEP